MFVAGPVGYLIVVKILFQISFFYLFLSYQCVDDEQGCEPSTLSTSAYSYVDCMLNVLSQESLIQPRYDNCNIL